MQLLMLDSGAYSVNKSGAEIDPIAYADFCARHPGVSYYVSLDVIPTGRRPDELTASCEKGWNNYLLMKAHVPQSKIIPVFHYGEDLKYLDRYLEDGVSYIGFGQTGAPGRTKTKLYMDSLRPRLFNTDGSPAVKTHGFAVTSFEYMSIFPWYSVDSSTWVKRGAFGAVWVPQVKLGNRSEFDYSRPPNAYSFSVKCPSQKYPKRSANIHNLTDQQRETLYRYMDSIKAKMGKYEVVDVPDGYKLNRPHELWQYGTRKQIIRILERGLVTCYHHRWRANAIFMRRAERAHLVNHLYLAGSEGSVAPPVEVRLEKRLMSYQNVQKEPSLPYSVFRQWHDAVGGQV